MQKLPSLFDTPQSRLHRKPKISILLCTYRPWPSILWNIQSLRRQTFQDWELVLAQHGVVLDSYLPEWLRPKTTSLYFEHDGFYRPVRIRNLSWRECRGRLIFFMHDFVKLATDDYLDELWRGSGEGECAIATAKIIWEVTKPQQVKLNKRECKVLRWEGEEAVVTHNIAPEFYLHQDAVPYSFLERINGFDPIYDPPEGAHGHDDLDTRDSLGEVGCKIVKRGDLISYKLGVARLYPLKGDSNTSNMWLYHSRGERERIFKKRQQ